MKNAKRARPAKYHGVGLFQIALIGTAFSALRVLDSPSTLTFFVFEIATAATLGIFLAGRASANRQRTQSSTRHPPVRSTDEDGSPVLKRLKAVASRFGATSDGNLEDLQVRIRFATLGGYGTSAKDAIADELASRVVVDRIVSTVINDGSVSASTREDYLFARSREAGDLLSLAQDLGLRSTAFQRVLKRAQSATEAGRTDAAIELLERENRDLRERLSAIVERDLRAVPGETNRAYLIASSVFFALVAMALWTLSGGSYIAPVEFHIFVAGAAGAIAANAHVSGNRRSVGVLVQILILATLLKFHFFFLNPYLYTSDTFFHFQGVQAIAATGRIPVSLGHYAFFPGLHVFGFAATGIAGLPASWYGLFAFVAQVLAVPAAYLVGREIASPRVGLFAAFFTMLSVFFFLTTIPLPSLFGFLFIFLALYAAIRIRRRESRAWFGVFWTSALAAFFSHPITALILLMLLLLRFAYRYVSERGKAEEGASSVPVLSYAVAYAGYLALIATISFQTFLGAFFLESHEPPLATTPSEALQVSLAYVVQSAMAPSSVAFLFFFAAYGMLTASGISAFERRFLVLLGAVFVLIPALEFISETFRGQAARFTSYVVIPLSLIGAHGAVRMFRSRQRRARPTAASIVMASFVVFAFLSTSAYLTNNDARYIYSEIPVIPTHITQSSLASRDFLGFATGGSIVYMDFGSWIYFYEDPNRARYSLRFQETFTLDRIGGRPGPAFVVTNDEFIPYGNPYLGILYDGAAVHRLLEDSQASRIFDAGKVQVYITP